MDINQPLPGNMGHQRTASSTSTLTEASQSSSDTHSDIMTYNAISRRLSNLDDMRFPMLLDDAVSEARITIFKLERGGDEFNNYAGPSGAAPTPQKLHLVLRAMLDCSDHDKGKRYAARAILTCAQLANETGYKGEERNNALLQNLRALGITWLTNLLYVFKYGSRSHEQPLNENPSDTATPTIGATRDTLYSEQVGGRTNNRSIVLRRDGWACVLTGLIDDTHPQPPPGIPKFTLNAGHLVKRAVAQFNTRKPDTVESAASTFDILVNYTRLSKELLNQLSTWIDHPSNKLTLWQPMHDRLDKYSFCLKPHPNGMDHHYRVHFFDLDLRPVVLNYRPLNATNDIVLTKHHPTDLDGHMPDPLFIHIHATIAGVLNMSGAGRFFDELLERHPPPSNPPEPLTWFEFERHVEARVAAASISAQIPLVAATA